MKLYLTMALILGFLGSGLCQDINHTNGLNENSAKTDKKITDSDRFNNFTTSNSAVKVIFKDFLTGNEILVVLSNYDLYQFVAYEKGYANIKGKFKNSDFEKKMPKSYVAFMEDNNNKPIVINIYELYSFCKKWIKYNYLVTKILTIQDFNVANEKEFIDKYIEFDKYGAGFLRKEYWSKFNDDASFKLLLIDLGYDLRCRDCYLTDWFITTVPMRR